jgi:MFS family permease
MILFIEFAVFVFTIHFALLLYVSSSYLEHYVSSNMIGFIYSIGAALTIWALAKTPTFFKRYGQHKTTLYLLFALAFISLLLGNNFGALIILPLFMILGVFQNVLRLVMDIYVEKFSKESKTGRIRGVVLTIMNTAIAISPFIAGKILDTAGFQKLFVISGLVLIPVILIVAFKLREVREASYHTAPFMETLRKIQANKNIYSIFIASFILEIFYTLMTVYTPILLNQNMKFSWTVIGTIFTIMLLPFMIFELPAGYLADKYLGEKEMLATGFIIMGITTMLISFVTTTTWYVWAVLLFFTRVGASLVESMTEIYFFKKVKPTDTDIMSFFRDARPFSYIVGPLAGGLLLTFIPLQYMFVILGIVMLFGVRYALAIKDTL